MNGFLLAIQALDAVAAAADAYQRASAIANALKQSAQQSQELTAEQSAELDAKAETVFASAASQPSGR